MSSRRHKKNLNKTSIGTIAACSGAVGLFIGLGVATLIRSKVSPHKDNLNSDVLGDGDTNQFLKRRLKKISNKLKRQYNPADQKRIEEDFDFDMYYERCRDSRIESTDYDSLEKQIKATFDKCI